MKDFPDRNAPSAYDCVVGRRSIRRFLPTPVPEETIDAILNAAARAPSGVNVQPWLVHAVTGPALERLSSAARSAARAGELSLEYAYLPDRMDEPYLSRRRKLGHNLYARYGIDRHDKEAREEAMLRNFDFFGAPVGLFFTMERKVTLGSWLDMGMFMQNVMIVARAFGFETCPQQAWCDHGDVVHRELGIPADHIILSGMALGHADPAAPENGLVSERVSAREFTVRHSK
jgi:nitroreductase